MSASARPVWEPPTATFFPSVAALHISNIFAKAFWSPAAAEKLSSGEIGVKNFSMPNTGSAAAAVLSRALHGTAAARASSLDEPRATSIAEHLAR